MKVKAWLPLSQILASVPSSLPEVTQATTNRPPSRAVVEAVNWYPDASSLTRNSIPTLLPDASNNCALIALDEPSWLGSDVPQTTTKPPPPKVETAGAIWLADMKL